MTNELTVVLVGCGSISEVWLSAIRDIPGIKVSGLVDLVKEKADRRAAEFGRGANAYTDLTNALITERPDAVFDCTVASQRLSIVRTAAEYGCHVLAEKPLAESLAKAREISGVATKAGITYAVIQNHRYQIGCRKLSKFLNSGCLGDITTCSSNFAVRSRFDDFRSEMNHVLLQDMAIHTFDVARLLLDAEPISVFCKEWNPRGSWFAHDASAVAIFEFNNGSIYTYQGSWCAHGLRTAWGSTWRINGTQGAVTWDGDEAFECEVARAASAPTGPPTNVPIPEYSDAGRIGGHHGVIAEFVECVHKGQRPETNAAENMKSLAMVTKAIESSERGEVVHFATT